MKFKYFIITLFIITFGLFCSKKESDTGQDKGTKSGELLKKEYNIIIVMDTIDDWSSGIRDGFKETLNKLLSEKGVTARYTVIDTELKNDKAKEIIKTIKNAKPDLICTINYPTAFADTMITQYLKEPEYKFVSENCVPEKSGIINNWGKPGGNVTGVGVFIQFNSTIRLMKKINPRANKLVFYSWDQMTLANDWFKGELTRATKEEGVQLVEFKTLKHIEETKEFLLKYANKGMDHFVMVGISIFVNKKGEFINAGEIEGKLIRENMRIGFTGYDENDIKYGKLAGTCVIWYDIGAQLAEKGLRILKGGNPGDIPWEYPRKFNIILNKKNAESLGITIPQEIINAAYRIYTDYNGNYIGQGK